MSSSVVSCAVGGILCRMRVFGSGRSLRFCPGYLRRVYSGVVEVCQGCHRVEGASAGRPSDNPEDWILVIGHGGHSLVWLHLRSEDPSATRRCELQIQTCGRSCGRVRCVPAQGVRDRRSQLRRVFREHRCCGEFSVTPELGVGNAQEVADLISSSSIGFTHLSGVFSLGVSTIAVSSEESTSQVPFRCVRRGWKWYADDFNLGDHGEQCSVLLRTSRLNGGLTHV